MDLAEGGTTGMPVPPSWRRGAVSALAQRTENGAW